MPGHEGRNRGIECGIAFGFQQLGQVAVREDAGQSSVLVGQNDRARPSSGATGHDEHVANRMRLARNAAFGERSHDIFDLGQLAT